MFSRRWQKMRFSRAWHYWHVFPRLTLVFFFSGLTSALCFPALDISGTFSRAWHQWHVFPRLTSVTCFPVLGISSMFSRVWHHWHVFPRLTSVSCFTAREIIGIFSRAWNRLHFALITRFFIESWLVHYVIEFVFIDQIDYIDLSFTPVSMKQLEYSIAVAFTIQAAIWSSDPSFNQRKNHSQRNVSTVSLITVLTVVTQRFSEGELRDDSTNTFAPGNIHGPTVVPYVLSGCNHVNNCIDLFLKSF